MSHEVVEGLDVDRIVSSLDEMLLDRDGRIVLRSAGFYMSSVPHLWLRVWCAARARYCIPTFELVNWLRAKIAGRKAIEIGAGNSDLGYHLEIPSTDSYIQQTPELKAYYSFIKQAPTSPPPDVLRMEAVEAVERLGPQVVVGAWITQKFADGMTEGNMYGPDEAAIIARVPCYIHVGNESVHAVKEVNKLPHAFHKFPWLVSRARLPEQNAIWVWGG